MSSRVFVDETKNRDYLLAAAVVMPEDLAAICRRTVRALGLPGQRRIHMAKESDPRRRAIVSAIIATRHLLSAINALKCAKTSQLNHPPAGAAAPSPNHTDDVAGSSYFLGSEATACNTPGVGGCDVGEGWRGPGEAL